MKPGCPATALAASARPRLVVKEVEGILQVEFVVINQLGSLYNLNKPMICYWSMLVKEPRNFVLKIEIALSVFEKYQRQE